MCKNRLFSRLALPIFIFFFLCGICFAESLQPFQGEINANEINVRSDSTVSAEVICVLKKGMRVEVVLEFFDWYKIRLPRNAPVYIKKQFLECSAYKTVSSSNASTPDNLKQECSCAKVIKDKVNIRLHPNETSSIIGLANKDIVVNVLQDKGDWYRIEPIANSFGWINKRHVNKAIGPATKTQDAASAAIPEGSSAFVGVIKPYSSFFKKDWTHKLITTDNKTFFLKGDKKSLDSLVERKVTVIGKIIDNPDLKYPLIQVNIAEAIN